LVPFSTPPLLNELGAISRSDRSDLRSLITVSYRFLLFSFFHPHSYSAIHSSPSLFRHVGFPFFHVFGVCPSVIFLGLAADSLRTLRRNCLAFLWVFSASYSVFLTALNLDSIPLVGLFFWAISPVVQEESSFVPPLYEDLVNCFHQGRSQGGSRPS